MDNKKLLRAWHILINDLSTSAADKLAEIANDGCLMDVAGAKRELAFVENCNWANEVLEHIADGEMDFNNLNECVDFIRRDQRTKDNLKALLKELFASAEEDFDDEYVDAIAKLVFQIQFKTSCGYNCVPIDCVEVL